MKILKTIEVTGDGVALDALLFQLLGREDMVPATLDANPGLAALGPILPAGTKIAIPAPITPEAAPAAEIVTLWSE